MYDVCKENEWTICKLSQRRKVLDDDFHFHHKYMIKDANLYMVVN